MLKSLFQLIYSKKRGFPISYARVFGIKFKYFSQREFTRFYKEQANCYDDLQRQLLRLEEQHNFRSHQKEQEQQEKDEDRANEWNETIADLQSEIGAILERIDDIRYAFQNLTFDLQQKKNENDHEAVSAVLDLVRKTEVAGSLCHHDIEERNRFLPILFQKDKLFSITEDIASLSKCEVLYLWGLWDYWKVLPILSQIKSKSIIFVEDGFLKSILTASIAADPLYHSGICFLVDDLGFHFDGTRKTRLETFINSEDCELSEPIKTRVQNLIERLVKEKLTKYNHQPIFKPNYGKIGRRKILVVDQAYNDFSITKSYANAETFKKMLSDAIAHNPDVDILIKTHPDMIAGARGGKSYYSDIKENDDITLIKEEINPYSLLEVVDKVYVCSSQLGFEALMAGKEVYVYGLPFYAGWGLTIDDQKCSRRTKVRTLEELFYAAYIKFSHYINPHKKCHCEIEEAIDYLLSLRKQYFDQHAKMERNCPR